MSLKRRKRANYANRAITHPTYTVAMWLLQLVESINEAENDKELLKILQSTYNSYVQQTVATEDIEATGKDRTIPVTSSIHSRKEFLRGYLRPYGLFPQTVFSMSYGRENGQENEELRVAVDRFFLDVHPIYAVDALTTCLAQFSSQKATTCHINRLLSTILLADFDRECVGLWDVETWKGIFPDKSWEQCCDWMTGWFVTLMETTLSTDKDCSASFHFSHMIPRIVEALMKENEDDVQDAEKLRRLQLLGSCLRRFLNRAHGRPWMAAVLERCRTRIDVRASLSQLVHCIRDLHAKEKFFQQLLLLLSEDFEEETALRLLCCCAASSDKTGKISDDAYYVLFRRLLLKEELSRKVARWIIAALTEEEDKLVEMVQQVARSWADRKAIDHLPLPRQAYLTFLLTCLLERLPGIFAEIGDTTLCRSLLDGVSNRLENCLETVRCQGMRVAHVMAAREPDTEPIFSHVKLDFQSLRREEEWEKRSEKAIQISSNSPTEVDSDDASDFSGFSDEDDPLEQPKLTNATDAILMGKEHPITLMELHQDLKRSEEPLKVITALKHLSVLIKECPSELPGLAAELSRTVVHVPLPDWIGEELRKEDAHALKGLKSSSAVRVCCLVLLLEAAPIHCGDSVALMICSKQVAEHHRLEILESLREAAKKLAAPPQDLPQVSETDIESTEVLGKARIWGVRSIAARKKSFQVWRNQYVDVAGLWISSLLLACKRVTHGFNLMERSPMVLGAVLITLATFAECASQSIVSTSLALSAFPLIRFVVEQKGENCYLRRCSLQAMTAMMQSLPIGRLSAILCEANLAEIDDETDKALKNVVVWIRSQGERILKSDQDETCKHLAAHCLRVCANASKAALELKNNEDHLTLRPQKIHYRIPERLPILPVDKREASSFKAE